MLPRLSIGAAADASEPGPGASEAELWESNDGPPVTAWRQGDVAHLSFPGLARYSFSASGGDCCAHPFPGARNERVVEAYERSVLPILFHARGGEALHASAIVSRTGVLAFAARSGTGKSTLAAAFRRRGFEAWADDALAWSMTFAGPVTLSLPFALRPKGLPPVAACDGFAPGTTRPLDGVVVLDRAGPGCVPALERVRDAARSLELLLPHAYCFTVREADSARRTLADYLGLLERMPLYFLRYGTDLERVDDIVDLLCRELSLTAEATRIEPA